MNEHLITPTSTENIEFQIEQSEDNTLQPFFTNLGKDVPTLSIDSLQHKLIKDMQYRSYQPASGSFSRNTELGIYNVFLGTTSINFKVYDKFDVLYELIQDEIFRFKRFVDSDIIISSSILERIAKTLSTLDYENISFDLSSDLIFNVRIIVGSEYILIVNIPLDDPDFFRDNIVFFSLFHNKELLISYRKDFNELIKGITTLNT